MGSEPAEPRSKLRLLLGTFARVAVTALVFGYLFSHIDGRAVTDSVSRIPASVALASVGSLLFGVATGVVRWRVLLVAAGARSLPGWLETLRIYFIGLFYNLLPGAVGGDVYRGYATRSCFETGGATRSVGVVFVERVCGFAGLLVLAAVATFASPLGNPLVLLYSGFGLCAALGAVAVVALGRRLSARLPGQLGKLAASLPIIEHPAPLAWALALSVLTHIAVSMTGFVVIDCLAPQITFVEGMAVFPLGTLAAFFPLTVAGAGARDTALVVLLGSMGISRADALATSLSMLACNLVVSGIGGLVQLRGRVSTGAPAIER